jgi:hypothetical protein
MAGRSTTYRSVTTPLVARVFTNVPERRALGCPLRSGRMAERGRKDAVHSDPVWRERADFIIGAPVPEEGRAEQLWARRLGEPLLFEICCIPFFLYDVALGDVIQTDASYELARIVKPSGRFVLPRLVRGLVSPAAGDR